MQRPTSVSAASWIWLFCALCTTVTIANIVTATNLVALGLELVPDEEELPPAEVIGAVGWTVAAVVAVTMVVQVVAAVALRDGARWARTLLAVATAVALVAVLYDITVWSAWVLLVANAVALVLAYGDEASRYLESDRRAWVQA